VKKPQHIFIPQCGNYNGHNKTFSIYQELQQTTWWDIHPTLTWRK